MSKLADFIGNRQIVDGLARGLACGHIFHAYVFAGVAGIGKTMLARVFARAVLCVDLQINGGLADACGVCKSCRAFDAGNHPDLVFVTTDKASIGVDNIREQINAGLVIAPYGQRRVYIIDNADTMTPQAQNALLKTLEEGNSFAMFLLAARNSELFLPTVLSRCIINKLRPLADEVVADYLIKAGHGADAAKAAAKASQGSIGVALALIDDEGYADFHREILDIAGKVDGMNVIDAFAAARYLDANKVRVAQVLDIFTLYYRDLLVGGAQASRPALDRLEAVDKARRYLNSNTNFLLTMEVMMLEMARI